MNATAATGLSSPLSVWCRWICIRLTFQMFLIASNIGYMYILQPTYKKRDAGGGVSRL